ncbi:hypothetical protein F5X96DRAFT_634477 [Biscogniauxia mediterranea]|nr:hypothetical protein F5X96DRAFT_634477 [Biscogniauxia mediterranea]
MGKGEKRVTCILCFFFFFFSGSSNLILSKGCFVFSYGFSLLPPVLSSKMFLPIRSFSFFFFSFLSSLPLPTVFLMD